MKHVELGNIIAPAKVLRAGNTDYPILSMTMRDGLVNQADKFKKQIASADTSQYKVVKRNQLVVGFPIDEGVLAFQRLYDEAIVSPAYNIWDLQGDASVDSNYLEAFLRSPIALAFYKSKLRSTTARRRTLPNDIFLSLPVPLPPLMEQERILKLLAEADELRQLRAQADQRTAFLIPALFHEMFGHPGENVKGWPVLPFGELLAEPLRNGLSPAKDGSNLANVFTLSAITGDAFDVSAWKTASFASLPDKSCHATTNLFLICRGNGNLKLVGRAKFPHHINEAFVFPDTMIAGVPKTDRLLSLFLEEAWKLPATRAQLESGARTTNGAFKINQTVIEGIRLPVPPLPLQREFAHRVTEIRELQASQASSRTRLHALFQSILHRAFNGTM